MSNSFAKSFLMASAVVAFAFFVLGSLTLHAEQGPTQATSSRA